MKIEFGDFAGAWRLEREIEDRAGGQRGCFDGEARLTPDEAGLIYTERGTLRLGTAPALTAERCYLWRPSGSRRIEVLFADGRPFHDFALDTTATARHLCDPDLYDVNYDFSGWPVWQASWVVAGPRKDYRMQSSYRR